MMNKLQLKREAHHLSALLMRYLRGTTSRKQLTRLLSGYSTEKVRKWETGQQRIEWDAFVQLAQLQNIPLLSLLTKLLPGLSSLATNDILRRLPHDSEAAVSVHKYGRLKRAKSTFFLEDFILLLYAHQPYAVTDLVFHLHRGPLDSPLVMVHLGELLPRAADQVTAYLFYPFIESLRGQPFSQIARLLPQISQIIQRPESELQSMTERLRSAGLVSEEAGVLRCHRYIALPITSENKALLAHAVSAILVREFEKSPAFQLERFFMAPLFVVNDKEAREIAVLQRKAMSQTFRLLAAAANRSESVGKVHLLFSALLPLRF